MDYRTVWNILRNKNILNPVRNIQYSFQKVRPHSQQEKFEHFMLKAAIAFTIFSKNGDGFLTEAEMRNGRCIDVLQIRNASNIIGYEIESETNKKCDVNGVDIIEIRMNRLPLKVKECLNEMEKWAQEIVV